MTRTSTITLTGVLALPALVLALSGCTGFQPSQVLPSESSSQDQPAGSGTPTHSMGDMDDMAGMDHSMSAEPGTVITVGLKFMPPDIAVKVGDTVTWRNGETIGHTITSGAWGDVNEATGLRGTQTPDGLFDHDLAPMGQEGDTFSFTFTEAGVFPYFCQPHKTMNATVTVTE